MRTMKVAVTMDRRTLAKLDQLVKNRGLPSRSSVVQEAVEEKLARMNRNRLARESAKLDPKFEKAMAEEGLSLDLDQWPEY